MFSTVVLSHVSIWPCTYVLFKWAAYITEKHTPLSLSLWQCATGRRYHLSIIPTPSLPGAVRHGSTCTETNCIPVTVARAGWCSTSSLLQVPAVARLNTTYQALALNTDKTRHSPSSDRKESSNTMQPDLHCWDLCRPVLSLMHNITGWLT